MIVNKKPPLENQEAVIKFNPGSVLLSHPCEEAVPSALGGLTSVFGMGTGVSLSLSPPRILSVLLGQTGTSAAHKLSKPQGF